MEKDTDVIVIGAGGGGPVVAKELGEKGIKVLLLEAGTWYGNKKWPNPLQEQGAKSSNTTEDLSDEILHRCFTDYEGDTNDNVIGRFRWGTADRRKPAWFRRLPQGGFAWQSSSVGGTTLLYFGNSPRAFPSSVNNTWPISYKELIPYYEKVESTLPVSQAPMTDKEELFFYGAKKAGWPILKTLDITNPGYRTQPNAILPPDLDINNLDFKFEYSTEGCTLCGHCINGCSIGPSVERVAKRSTLVSYIPLALKTNNVEVRPNTFVTKILTRKDNTGNLKSVGIKYKDTWTGENGELKAKVIVMSAGPIESPRLWLNSKLPNNPWIGKGLTNHWFDCISGIFKEKVLMNILGTPDVRPYVGQNSAARFDYPGLGALQGLGVSPGIYSTLSYSLSRYGYNFLHKPAPEEPWDIRGRVVGQELKEIMMSYPQTLSILLFTDDTPNDRNTVTLDNLIKDENGFVPVIKYIPSKNDIQKRDKLAAIAADILKKAGASKIIRTDCTSGLLVHMQSTMRMGHVTDTNCEAKQVKRLFIADNSVLYNSLGGANPTLTTQALATRTVEKIVHKYFN
ncbi:GMC family oxidoreductase N-terminal domain-containing protein [Clostridium kluyveri]|uniref:Glucose-methanol-choline oxidoreductase n=1 Tax=Clostridium kluyveri TaxID=1534 RepID=A0A1L5F865_CLOKL|nr:GMC family oxidoreductase N-terminal domain-containing protein [Clostridium kluyveri]APM39204.1 glucose-methanol-choline oxidoreductase [Clostridium kluyveri]